MLNGTLEITIDSVETLDIHGSVYYDISFTTAGGQQSQMRINPEAFYRDPKPGDKVAVNMVMGNIMGANKLN